MLALITPVRIDRRAPSVRGGQAGVALGVALMILVVITLLGILGIRRAQLQARLSQNAEATVTARGTATNNARSLTTNSLPLLSQAGGNQFNACWSYKDTVVPTETAQTTFTCPTNDANLATFAATLPLTERPYSYFVLKRETPATLPTTALRDANLSSIAYQFASFSVMSGYDASGDRSGVAEVSQAVLQPVARVPGITEQ